MTTSLEKVTNVLVIDDDDISNFIYTRVISSSGYVENIKSCMSGQEALDYLENLIENNPTAYPEMIFLDINMPVMNGWSFLEEYSERIPIKFQESTILCILSSSVYKDDINKASTYPQVKEYVPKPLSVEALKAIMNKYFNLD